MSGENENTASQEMDQRVSVETPDAEALKMEALAGIGGISERPEEGETHAQPKDHTDGQTAEGDETKEGRNPDGNGGAGDVDNEQHAEGDPKEGEPSEDPEKPAQKQEEPEEEVKLNPHLPAKVKADFDKLLRQKISWREKAEAAEKASAEYRGIVENMAQSVAETGLPAEHLPKFVDFAAKAIVAGDAQAMEKVGARLLELGWKPQGHGESGVNVEAAVKAALDHYVEHYDTEAAMAAAKAVKAEKTEGTPRDAAKEAERKQEQEAKAHDQAVKSAVVSVKGLIESETKGMQPEEAKAFMKRVDALLLGSIDKDDPTSWKAAYSVAFRMVKANGTAKPADAKKPPIVVQGKKTPSAVPKHSPGSYEALKAEAMNGLKK